MPGFFLPSLEGKLLAAFLKPVFILHGSFALSIQDVAVVRRDKCSAVFRLQKINHVYPLQSEND